MRYTQVRNPRWANQENTLIECEVIFPDISSDFLPFGAIASGDQEHTHEIFARCLSGEFGEIAAYAPPLPIVPPTPTPEEIIQSYTKQVQLRLDSFAKTRNYDGILSACTYATSTIQKFAAEGQYCVNARDATWTKCYEIMDAVLAGTRPMPTLEELMLELPELVWPI